MNDNLHEPAEGLAIDLFCGAGGFSLGFERAGVEVLYGFDVDEAALETFEASHDAASRQYDLTMGVPDNLQDSSDDIEIVFGSPPCQGFSDARGSRSVDDEKNNLVFEFIRWVEALQPKVVAMENVPGMLTISEDFIPSVYEAYEQAGYQADHDVLNAAKFGVPQKRKRVVFIAVRNDLSVGPTIPTPETSIHHEFNITPPVGTLDAFSDLPEPTELGDVEMAAAQNAYQRYVRKGATETTDHVANAIPEGERESTIVNRLEPGEMFRSNRFGPRYRQVWDLLRERFTEVERCCLEHIARHRSKKEYRIKGKTVGPVHDERILEDLCPPHSKKEVKVALNKLLDEEWTRSHTADDGRFGYDLNTKSGIRPRWMRPVPDKPSNTILTHDFQPRNKLHPTKNRGLSLREGARIQSFPDVCEFKGTHTARARQIGNAVPPLLAHTIANHLLNILHTA